jgi:hypothetical protein
MLFMHPWTTNSRSSSTLEVVVVGRAAFRLHR